MVVLLSICLYSYIEFTSDQVVWGQGILGLKYHIALNSLLGIEESATLKMLKAKKKARRRRHGGGNGEGGGGRAWGPDTMGAPTPVVAELGPSTGAISTGKSGFWRPQLLVVSR